MISLANHVGWGSWPSIPLSFSYEKQRSGADMQYRFSVVIGQVWSSDGSQYFGYPIYCNILLDGVDVSGQITLKGAAPSAWGGTIPYTSDWYTVRGKACGTTDVTFRMRGGSRDDGFSYTLEVDPGASVLSVADGVLGMKQTLTVTRYDESFTHTITYACGSDTGIVCTNAQDTVVAFMPPVSWAVHNTTGTSVPVTFSIQTYAAEAAVGDPVSVTAAMSIPEDVKPTLSDGWAAVTPNNTGAVTGISCYVQGYSRALVSFDDSRLRMAYGAEIASYKVVCGAEVVTAAPYQTAILQSAGLIALKCTVTDSRGRSAEETLTITVQPYAKPTLWDIEIFRSNSIGVASDTGLYIAVKASAGISSLAGENTKKLQVRYKTSVGSYTPCVTISDGVLQVIGDGTISASNSYVVELLLTDRPGNTARFVHVVPTETVFFSGLAGGGGAGFGKHPETEDWLEVAWNLLVKKQAEIEGGLTVGGALQLGEPLAEENGGTGMRDLTALRRQILLEAYPVNSVYLSYSHTSPAQLFGGTWQRIANRFLYGGDGDSVIGETGGNADHQHEYGLQHGENWSAFAFMGEQTGLLDYDDENNAAMSAQENMGVYTAACNGNTGGSQTTVSMQHIRHVAHTRGASNLPPYVQVAIWRRIA